MTTRISKQKWVMFFALVNVARYLGVDPRWLLENLPISLLRFHFIEDMAAKQGRNLAQMDLSEMDAIWNVAKNRE